MWPEIKTTLLRLEFAIVLLGLIGASANAQLATIKPIEAPEAATDEVVVSADKETVEEIVVVGRKPGSRRRVDPIYEDPMRVRLLKDLEESREDEEEYKWLAAEPNQSSPNVQWGYDPRDDYLTRDKIDRLEVPSDNVRPATLFKIGF